MKLDQKQQDWIKARQRHHLSHAHIQMARELGLDPNKIGRIDNHRQEPWKAPLSQFIERLYLKATGRERPENVMSVEEQARARLMKKAAHREAKLLASMADPPKRAGNDM